MMTPWQRATTLDEILRAIHRAAEGKKDRPDVARFLMDAEREGLRLQRALRAPVDHPAAWWPAPADTFQIRDPKPRTITVAPFPDRVVHHVLCAAFEPALERYSIFHSYACRKGKGQHLALRQCQRFARKASWAIKGDVRSFFASVPHSPVLERIRRRVGDAEICARVERALGGPAPSAPHAARRGLAIGSLISQHLANFYLGELDHWLTDGLGFGGYLRYMDDFIVFGERAELRALLPRIVAFLGDRLDLRLNEHHSRLQPVRDGIPFLGFRVYPRLIRVSARRWRRFRRRHEALEESFERGELSEEALGRALESQYAHLRAFDTFEARRGHLRRLAERRGRGRAIFQPGEPGRLVEERPAERARRQPRQGRALQPQRQPGFSGCELKTPAVGSERSFTAGPDGTASRSVPLCPGLDQTSVPCSVPEGIAIPSRRPGTEPLRPGGGASRVAAGPSFLSPR